MRYSKSIADKLVQDDIIQETDKIVVEFGLRQLFAVLRSLSIKKSMILQLVWMVQSGHRITLDH